jgi:hypothetical protein
MSEEKRFSIQGAEENIQEPWRATTLPKLEKVTRTQMVEMFQGNVAAIRTSGFLTEKECATAVTRIHEFSASRGRRYKGDLNIGTALSISSHWEFEYQIEDDAAWLEYFRKVGPTTRMRRKLFAGIGDPVDRIVEILGQSWPGPVRRALHPKFNRRLYVGLLRTGSPRLHFDWAPFDLPSLKDVVMQAGANVYLSNSLTGGDLKIYRRYGMLKGNKASSGKEVVGNYDIPHAAVAEVESCIVPCRTGDFVIAPNRFLHEVTPGDSPEKNRLVLSFHVAWMGDGSLTVFS